MSLIDIKIGAIQRRRKKRCRKNTRESLVRSLLQELCPGHEFEKARPAWNRNPRTGACLELDCYAPRLITAEFPGGLAIEVHGIQHHKFCWLHEDEADDDIRKWTTMTITTPMVMFMMTTMS